MITETPNGNAFHYDQNFGDFIPVNLNTFKFS